MEKIKIDKFILDIVDIPRRDREDAVPKFWQVLESEELKTAMVFCLLNDLRSFNAVDLTDVECRAWLTRCQSYVSMIDLDETLMNQIRKTLSVEDDVSPADVEFEDED